MVSIVVHRAVPTLVESSTAHTHTVPRPPASLGSAPRSRPVHRPLSQNPGPPCTAQTPTFWGRNRVAVEVGSRTLAAAAVPLAGCRRSALRARPLGWRARPPTPSFTRGTAPCSCPTSWSAACAPRGWWRSGPHRGPAGTCTPPACCGSQPRAAPCRRLCSWRRGLRRGRPAAGGVHQPAGRRLVQIMDIFSRSNRFSRSISMFRSATT